MQLIPTTQLKKREKNPRKIDQQQLDKLCKNIESDPEFFNLRPCLVKQLSDKKYEIYAGNQRFEAAKKLGWKKIPCIISEAADDLIKKRIVLDNTHSGEFDYEILKQDYDFQQLESLGFKPEELESIFESIQEIISPTEDESEVLEPCNDEDAITKLGDIYELNNHRIVCGDSTLPEYTELCLAGVEPILMVTDPPYGVEYDASWRNGHDLNLGKGFDGKQGRSIGKVHNDDKIDWSLAYCQFNGSIAYIWHAGKYSAQIAKHLENCDFEIAYQIIWAKQHFVFGRGDYHWQHEPCWYAVKKGCNHNYQGDRTQTTLWQINNNNPFGSGSDKEEKTGHSTQKPIECMARPIRNNTAKGEGVYDPFLGSGTTLIAAEMLDRICYGIELSPAYCDIIVDRWKRFMIKNNKEFIIKKNGEIYGEKR
jgi:DNA modification methylase